MWGREPRKRKVHLAVTVVAGVAAFLFGLLFAQLSSGGEGPAGTGGDGVGPSREAGGVGVGFAHSPAGAAAAVASYQRDFAETAILRPGVLRRRVEVVATPGYATRMLAANSPGARRIGDGPIGVGAREGLQTLFVSVPVGYRVESYSRREATVLTWGFTLLGNAGAVEPGAYFGLAHTDLVWSGGDWKIGRVRSGFGPTPKIETGGKRLGGYDLLALARGLKSYGSAP
jgi:hypothetical protein